MKKSHLNILSIALAGLLMLSAHAQTDTNAVTNKTTTTNTTAKAETAQDTMSDAELHPFYDGLIDSFRAEMSKRWMDAYKSRNYENYKASLELAYNSAMNIALEHKEKNHEIFKRYLSRLNFYTDEYIKAAQTEFRVDCEFRKSKLEERRKKEEAQQRNKQQREAAQKKFAEAMSK